MPRITLPDPATLDADQRAVYDRVVSGKRGKIQGPLRAALHNAELASRWSALGELLRYNTSLTPRQSELAILVTGRACNSPFEWYAHRLEGEKAGLSTEILEALLAQQIPEGLDDTEHAIVCFARELNAHNSVSDATYARTLALLGEKAIVELTALVGYYTMVAMTLNTHEIPLPEGVTPAFPLPQRDLA
ncbi:4-carboxymuconolactone decarboxylase [Pseudoxanthomonas sp. GM95]|uniref:carboxymuconolactone decarboxylase family protein n=1 Tax=Pseudoxanthomonas sp. GM95 TaxID=1881043 RepID=UPI0008C5F8AB|nr:carboxymuconolactone decarboxylase family protein [Pseudoxanthomonas sp. GM95]SEL58555.1 4-carboxymuconolactone decarboxylase [Pseudoxanthomonas sp. GM95]